MLIAEPAGFVVCVFDAPESRSELGEMLRRHFEIPRIDAMRLAAAAPGVLPLRLTEAAAECLAERIRLLGLDAACLNAPEAPRIDDAEEVHHVRCDRSGLDVMDMHSVVDRSIPLSSIEMIAVGQLPDGLQRHFPDDNRLITAARHSPHTSYTVPATPGPELWLVTRDPVRSLRVHHERMNYEYLRNRRTTSSTVNFRMLVEDLVRLAPRAFQSTSTQAYLASDHLRLYSFDTVEDFERWSRLQLLTHRASQLREIGQSLFASATPTHPLEASGDLCHGLPQEPVNLRP